MVSEEMLPGNPDPNLSCYSSFPLLRSRRKIVLYWVAVV